MLAPLHWLLGRMGVAGAAVNGVGELATLLARVLFVPLWQHVQTRPSCEAR